MHVAALLLAHSLAARQARTWYGPVTAIFETQFAGNPYDPITNDVHVKFVSRDGKTVDRLAYYSDGAWRADLVGDSPGLYTATLERNGAALPDAPALEPSILLEDKLDHGFLHVDPLRPNRFRYDDGTSYFPIGLNVHSPSPETVARLAGKGINWLRIWPDPAIGAGPFPNGVPDAMPRELWPPDLERWAVFAHACVTSGVSYDLPLFDGDAFGRDWAENPWNVSKGGFLKDASDFFTDAEAKRRTKMWLRYAVARFAPDPNLMAFELLDRPELTDAARSNRWPEIEAWIGEMSAYLRALDPYDHMVTGVSTSYRAGVFQAFDCYAGEDGGGGSAPPWPEDKPFLDAAFVIPGVGDGRSAVRKELWHSILANLGGATMPLVSNPASSEGVFKEVQTAATVLKDSDFARHGPAKSLSLRSSNCTAKGIGQTDWALLRLTSPASGPFHAEVGGVSVPDGPCNIEIVDLNSGQATKLTATVTDARLRLALPGPDCAVIVTPRAAGG